MHIKILFSRIIIYYYFLDGEISFSKVGKYHFQRTEYPCHHIRQRMCNWLPYIADGLTSSLTFSHFPIQTFARHFTFCFYA